MADCLQKRTTVASMYPIQRWTQIFVDNPIQLLRNRMELFGVRPRFVQYQQEMAERYAQKFNAHPVDISVSLVYSLPLLVSSSSVSSLMKNSMVSSSISS